MKYQRRSKVISLLLLLSCTYLATMSAQKTEATQPPQRMRLCISPTACANLTWASDHYDGRGDNETEVSSRYWITVWKTDHVELTGKTAKAVDGVYPAEGRFHGRISPSGGSLIDALYDWRVGYGKSGTADFTLRWDKTPSNVIAAANTGRTETPQQAKTAPDVPPPGALPPVASRPKAQANEVAELTGVPGALHQCEGDQCTRGGGGAVWLFQGRTGQAMWHYGAVASLTVQKFDGHTIIIHREDPNPSYSSPRFADLNKRPDGVFFADYVGTIHGNRIDGTVTFNGGGKGTWYAAIPDALCEPFDECPLDLNQFMRLGHNAAQEKLYASALHCFLIGAAQGNGEAQSLAGLMLRDGHGVPANEGAAFYLLKKSAEQGNYNGELGLAQMYEAGEGTQKDPQQAAFWRNRAQAQLQQMQAQQQQREASNALGALLFLGLAAAIIGESGPSGDSGESHSSFTSNPNEQRMQRERDFDYWSHGGTNISAPDGYRCATGPC